MTIDLLTSVRQHVLVSEGSLLSLPQSLLRIRQLAHALESDVYDVEQCVLQDPAFAGYLLKLANSSLFQAGKEPCSSVADAIRRQGIHAVAQLAMVYVLQRKHMLKDVSPDLQRLLQKNWQRSSSLARESVAEYQAHRADGAREARRIDVSDILLLGTLYYCGALAALSACALPSTDIEHATQPLDEFEKSVLGVNTRLLPEVFRFWSLEKMGNQLLQSGDATGELQPLRAADYVRLVLMRRAMSISKDEAGFIERNRVELERFDRLGLYLNAR